MNLEKTDHRTNSVETASSSASSNTDSNSNSSNRCNRTNPTNDNPSSSSSCFSCSSLNVESPFEVELNPNSAFVDCLESVLSFRQVCELKEIRESVVSSYRDRLIWNVSSTSRGGGVAEILDSLVPACKASGVDMKWVVIRAPLEFFRITKRIHNGIHGLLDNSMQLTDQDRIDYESTLEKTKSWFISKIHSTDVVILHDPQTAGLTDIIKSIGATVIWRCHIGINESSECSRRTWDWLLPSINHVDATVFSRHQYIPPLLKQKSVTNYVIHPAIDPCSLKNCDLDQDTIRRILRLSGLIQAHGGASADLDVDQNQVKIGDQTYHIRRKAEVIRFSDDGLRLDVPLVIQVSRWDRLKDMAGVLKSYAEYVVPRFDSSRAHLMLVGPETRGVNDDPEATMVWDECVEYWHSLSEQQRRSISLVCLPMEDKNENFLMVNALQRYCSIVVQKSLQEGFGLTVTEAMWKAKPVIASDVGGIVDQIQNNRTGILIQPTDLQHCGYMICQFLGDLALAKDIGMRAKESVRAHYLYNRQLVEWVSMLHEVDKKYRATPVTKQTHESRN